MPEYGRSLRPSASSPIPGPRPSSQPVPVQDPSLRVMRLKVLYTFDEDKTNCLARWPHPLSIRTAFLNPETQIGVIELKTCVQAIAAASPEIVAGLGQDYTVYAYDYSEYETPLVGQGMLSWALASASSTPGAPAERSLTMVTGRVSRNVMGLFSGAGISQETLEVKLRLVPVPTSRQSEYLESMRKYRDISQMIPPGFDAQVWTTFLQQNPGFMQQAMQHAMPSRSQSPTANLNQAGQYGIEHVQRLLSGDPAQSNQTRQPLSRANSSTNVEAVQRLPRLPSPASSIASAVAAPKKRGRKPGPKPKTAKGRKNIVEPALDSTDPGYGTGDDALEEGSSRKRARVMHAEWDGKQDFGKQQDSLRVAASTAASVRIHQPTAVRPGQNAHLSLDNQPRAPTPIADLSQKQSRPRLPVSKSNLGRHSMLSEVSSAEPRRAASASDKAPEWSPEKSQAESSPLDIASSPPIFPGNSTTQSSPRLPGFPRTFDDSGFMSGAFDDLFDDEELRPLDDDDYAAAAQYSKRPDLPACSGGAHESAQTNSFPPNTHAQPLQQAPEEPQQHSSLEPESHNSCGTYTSIDAFPPINVPNSARPSGLTRSQTWSGNDPPHPASDGPPAQLSQEHTSRPSSRGRARRQSDTGGHTGVKRKAAIQSRLANSMAAGEVPPFCDHCGAIETATWRKAWSKVHSGTPEHVHLSEDEGAILAWQTLQTDSSGVICLYRIIKKTLLKHDEGFTEMLLCNPCGMYLFTKKCMRPKDMWNRSQKGPDDKGKRKPNGRGRKSISDGPSSDAGASKGGPGAEPSSPSEAPKQSEAVEQQEPQLPVLKRRSTSDAEARMPRTDPGLDEAATAAALERAIKSSPHKFAGTRKSPIEVTDITPQPIRRVLFPSPSRSERFQSMSKASSLADASKRDVKQKTPQASNNVTTSSSDKENQPPAAKDDIDRFFNEEGYGPIECHNNSSPSKSRPPCVVKTPTRSSARRYPGESMSGSKSILRWTPKRSPMKGAGPLTELTPFTAHLNQLLSEANDMSPGMDRIDFAALPSLRNTPSASRFMDFDFGQFDSQDLISTDVPMPSSPPVWNTHTFADAVDGGQESPWGEEGLPQTITSPAASQKTGKDGHEGECIGEANKENSEQREVIPV